DLYRLRYLAEELLKKELESAPGVAAIKVNGGYEEEIQVRVDEGKLSLVGVGIRDVNERLSQENVNQAGGSLYEQEARYLVRSNNEFLDVDDVRETVLVSEGGRTVRVRDIADVRRGHKRREVVTRFGGGEAVELALYKEGDANTVQVARAVLARLDVVRGELPEGIELVKGVDQSEFIRASIREVLMNALIGGAIAMLVLLFFLKNPISTVIIGLSIPISIVTTFFLMYRTGTTLNIMSLGGLALGVGMLVDSAIVVLEAIFKHREAGVPAFEAALRGASEVGKAVAASTFTTVAVFLPVVFLQGIAAQLFRDMALAVSFSLLASLAVSLTLIPMLAALLGSVGAGASGDAGRAAAGSDARVGPVRRAMRFVLVSVPGTVLKLARIAVYWLGRGLALIAWPVSGAFDAWLSVVTRGYPGVLRWALRSRALILAVALAAFTGSMLAIPRLGFDLIPAFSQGEFSYRVELPEGTPLEVTDRFLAETQRVLAGDERVASVSSIAGGSGLSLASTGTEGENVGRIQVRIAPGLGADVEDDIIEVLRDALAQADGVRFEFERPTYFSFRTPIEVEVYSDDLSELHNGAAALRSRLERVPGVVDVRSSAELGNPELQIVFDRDKMARLNLALGDVAQTVRNKIQGEVATRFLEGDREIDIVVRSVEPTAASVESVRRFIVAQRGGVPIILSSVADIRLAEGPSEIRRLGQKRAAVVSANVTGRDMGGVAADVRSVLSDQLMPAGVTMELSGQEEERARSLRGLMLAMALAIFLVYLVMASQFESFLHPFVIIFSLPLGAIGVVAALALTGQSVSIVAMIGAVMLAGIVVNNAIVLVDAVNQRRSSGMTRADALVAAGSDRLRPILMTSATTVLGLLPMALGLGEGSELRAPLAITVIGGLTLATLLTLVVIPVVYTLVDRGEEAVSPEAAVAAAAAREHLALGGAGTWERGRPARAGEALR
ncbi:MAG: efflux RND transporter permease subunit, partial [Longimicrobiales bacterium]